VTRALLLALVFVGCGPAVRPIVETDIGPGRITVQYQTRSRDLADSTEPGVLAHFKAFERDYGPIRPQHTVRVFYAESVPCGSVKRAIGCYQKAFNLIDVVDADGTVPALYHEFAHAFVLIDDPFHRSPHWGAIDSRAGQVVQEILRARD
jgi:hypothetical protein